MISFGKYLAFLPPPPLPRALSLIQCCKSMKILDRLLQHCLLHCFRRWVWACVILKMSTYWNGGLTRFFWAMWSGKCTLMWLQKVQMNFTFSSSSIRWWSRIIRPSIYSETSPWDTSIHGTQNLVPEQCAEALHLLEGHLYLGVGKGHFFWVSKPGFNLHSGNTLALKKPSLGWVYKRHNDDSFHNMNYLT